MIDDETLNRRTTTSRTSLQLVIDTATRNPSVTGYMEDKILKSQQLVVDCHLSRAVSTSPWALLAFPSGTCPVSSLKPLKMGETLMTK